MKIDSQVLVVGAGPAGLALAAELEIAGIHTVVVEQLAEPDTLQMARGVGVLAEIGDRPLAGSSTTPESSVLGHWSLCPSIR